MDTKPILPYSHFLPRLQRCRAGMLQHKNEAGTVANLRRHLEDRLIKTMEHPTAGELRDEVALFLVHDNQEDSNFAHNCMVKALRQTFAGQSVERQAFGQFVNALAKSKHRHEFAITRMIESVKPLGWSIPKPKQEDAAAAA